jgi:hypothetical protein
MSRPTDRLRIVVLGYIVRGPIGGMAWHHLQYVLGLKALGHDVLFIEDSGDYPSCYDPSRHVVDGNPNYGLAFATEAFGRLGLGESWAYYDAHTGAWHGAAADRVASFCETADLILNVSGVNPLRPWTAPIERRVFLDTDPLFTQIRHLTDAAKRSLAKDHNQHFTFGESLGIPRATVPPDGFDWKPTRQPIVLDAWKASPGTADGRFTTVMQWDSYSPVEYGGMKFGMKSNSFKQFVALPRRVSETFEIALGGHEAPREELRAQGWWITDSLEVTRDPWTYQRYIAESKAEFSVAKHGYAASYCGWFSERSACYLATGRPVVMQETGFSRHLPVGRGLLTFSDIESAAAAVEEVSARYDAHCRAAREICEAYFDSRVVLTSLLERCMNP